MEPQGYIQCGNHWARETLSIGTGLRKARKGGSRYPRCCLWAFGCEENGIKCTGISCFGLAALGYRTEKKLSPSCWKQVDGPTDLSQLFLVASLFILIFHQARHICLGKEFRSSFSLLPTLPHSPLKFKPLAPPELTGFKAASFSALTFQRVGS